jgi:hypothetical protein
MQGVRRNVGEIRERRGGFLRRRLLSLHLDVSRRWWVAPSLVKPAAYRAEASRGRGILCYPLLARSITFERLS